jgi:hypothetical protein
VGTQTTVRETRNHNFLKINYCRTMSGETPATDLEIPILELYLLIVVCENTDNGMSVYLLFFKNPIIVNNETILPNIAEIVAQRCSSKRRAILLSFCLFL